MKHKIQLPMIIGVFSIIAIFLMAAECNKTEKKSDNKADKTTKKVVLTIGSFKASANTAGAVLKEDGGIASDKSYILVSETNKAKAFTLVAKDTAKGKIKKAELKQADGSTNLATTTAEAKIAADETSVTINLKKADMFYLTLKQGTEADEKYLIVNGTVDPAPFVVLDDTSYKEGADADASNGVLTTAADLSSTTVTVTDTSGNTHDKIFILAAKVDNLPTEAPKLGKITYAAYAGDTADTEVVASISDQGKVTLASSRVDKTVDVKAIIAAAAPYKAVSKKVYDINW